MHLTGDAYTFFPRRKRRTSAARRRRSSAGEDVASADRQHLARELLVAYLQANRGEAMPSLVREFSKVLQGVLAIACVCVSLRVVLG